MTYSSDWEKLKKEVDERIDAMHPSNYEDFTASRERCVDEASWKHDSKELKCAIRSLLQAREEWLREDCREIVSSEIDKYFNGLRLIPHPELTKDVLKHKLLLALTHKN